jgi:hypothetical protein
MKDSLIEFLLTIVAIIIGLIVAKKMAQALASINVNISSGNPLGVSVQGTVMADTGPAGGVVPAGDFGPWYGGSGA